MAKARAVKRRRKVPPQLRPYLFTKGRRKGRRKGKIKRVVRRHRVMRVRRRRRNPLQAPSVQHFIFARRGGGQRLHYNGEKFTTNGAPAYFRYKAQAETIARELLRKFPVLRTYDVYVGDTARKH